MASAGRGSVVATLMVLTVGGVGPHGTDPGGCEAGSKGKPMRIPKGETWREKTMLAKRWTLLDGVSRGGASKKQLRCKDLEACV